MLAVPAILIDDDQRYDLCVILQDDNIARMKTYDPAELLTANLPQIYQSRKIRNVIIMYATEEEVPRITAMCRAGQIKEALKYLSRGWVFRPEAGDNDDPYRHVCALEGNDHV